MQGDNGNGGYQNIDSNTNGKSKKRKNGAAKLSVFPDKNITYMWCDINVFTSKAADSHKTSSKLGSILNTINCFKSSSGGSKRKHILQNGESGESISSHCKNTKFKPFLRSPWDQIRIELMQLLIYK